MPPRPDAAAPPRGAVRAFAELVALVHEVSAAGARELGALGRSPGQFQALRMISTREGCTQQQLAASLGVTKGNVSQLVARLESDGLIARVAAGASYELTLTPDGARVLDDLVPRHEAFLEGVFSVLDPDELAAFRAAAARVRGSRG